GFADLAVFYALGTLVVAGAAWALPWLGLSPLDDVAERRNRPAGWAILGAQVGLTLAYGLATGGTGPRAVQSGWAPPGVGLMGVLVLFALWAPLEKLLGFSEAITVDRDGGAACRLAALLVALGLPVGLALPDLVPVGGPGPVLLALPGPALLLL